MRNAKITSLIVITLSLLFATAQAAVALRCDAHEMTAALQPNARSYADAIRLSNTLVVHGFTINCILSSKMDGTFRGMTGAALFRTDHGDFDALFVPDSQSFERLKVTESREDGWFVYSLRGFPEPPDSSRIESSQPDYFVKHANQLIVIYHDEVLRDAFEEVFGLSSDQPNTR